MGDLKRQWTELSLETKLGIVVVPLVVAVIGAAVPLLASTGGDDKVAGGSAEPNPSAVGYRKDVGRVCDDLNSANRARRRSALRLKKDLLQARETMAQRDATINDTQRTLDRSAPIYAAFAGLSPPSPARALHETTARAWKDSLRLLRGYRSRLEDGTTRERLIAELERFKRGSSLTIENNGVEVRTGLERLGGAECDLAVPKTVPVFTLPPVEPPAPPRESNSPPTEPRGTIPTATGEPPIVPTPTPNGAPRGEPSPQPEPTPEPTLVPTAEPTPVPTPTATSTATATGTPTP